MINAINLRSLVLKHNANIFAGQEINAEQNDLVGDRSNLGHAVRRLDSIAEMLMLNIDCGVVLVELFEPFTNQTILAIIIQSPVESLFRYSHVILDSRNLFL